MILQPKTSAELSAEFKRLSLSNGKVEQVELSQMSRIIEYAPEDMTITVQTGMLLKDLQDLVSQHRQWLPIDPAHGAITLHDLLARNLSGPRRLAYGTIRDYVLGIQAVTGDGETIRSGGRVVKNVAGYDLGKLFIGSGITLGVITEATFMLRPLPEKTEIWASMLPDLQAAPPLVEQILRSETLPVGLDLHNLSGKLELRVCLEGFSEDVMTQANNLHDFAPFERTTFDLDAAFFNQSSSLHSISVLPSQVVKTIERLDGRPFLARAGNGVVYYGGPALPRQSPLPAVKVLSDRLKQSFDPHFILPFLHA
ncbi:MAG: FAD-binding oxidoreductase [Verrucomicrobiales bacterium]